MVIGVDGINISSLFDILSKEGNYVLFVVWSNFISSFLYLVAVYGLLNTKKWTYKILGLSAIVLTVAFIAFLFYFQSGGIHETKTAGAMVFRITLTIAFTHFAYFTINKNNKP